MDRQHPEGRYRALKESSKSIYTAIAANLLIACAKFAAAFFTSSAAMAAEGIHTLVDAGNGSLVLLGKRLAAEPADAAGTRGTLTHYYKRNGTTISSRHLVGRALERRSQALSLAQGRRRSVEQSASESRRSRSWGGLSLTGIRGMILRL